MGQIRHLEIIDISIVVSIVLFAAWSLGAGAALAEPQPWDQKEAARLSEAFSQSLSKIASAAKTAPLQQTAIQQRTRDGAVNRLGSVREAADALAKQIASGRDGAATELFFAQVRQLFNQMRSVAGDAVASKEQEVNLAAAEELLDQLARYYDY